VGKIVLKLEPTFCPLERSLKKTAYFLSITPDFIQIVHIIKNTLYLTTFQNIGGRPKIAENFENIDIKQTIRDSPSAIPSILPHR
jgi:hypothetical protein